MDYCAFVTLLILMNICENSRCEVATLQCYVCENCALDEGLKQGMETCSDAEQNGGQMITHTHTTSTTTTTRREPEPTQPKQEATTTTAAAAETRRTTTIGVKTEPTASATESAEYSDEYYSDQETEKAEKLRKERSASETENASVLSALTIAASPLLLEASSERDRKLKANQHVCYVIHLNANNTLITNRGCATLKGSKLLTCHSLSKGLSIDNCRICTTDGCNVHSAELWSSAGPVPPNNNLVSGLVSVFSLLLLSYVTGMR